MNTCLNCKHGGAVLYENKYTGYYACALQAPWLYHAACNISRHEVA